MRDDTKIIIGTVSKRVQAAKKDLSDAWSELVCKIVRADNVFIASAGIAGINPYKQHGKDDAAMRSVGFQSTGCSYYLHCPIAY